MSRHGLKPEELQAVNTFVKAASEHPNHSVHTKNIFSSIAGVLFGYFLRLIITRPTALSHLTKIANNVHAKRGIKQTNEHRMRELLVGMRRDDES